MMTLQFYTRKDCALCTSALAVVRRVQKRVAFNLDVVDIDLEPALRERYDSVIPVLCCGEIELARSFFDEKKLNQAVQKVSARPPADTRP